MRTAVLASALTVMMSVTSGMAVPQKKTAHAGMTITEPHWKAFMEDLSASFDAVKVPVNEKAEALASFTKLKPEIGIK